MNVRTIVFLHLQLIGLHSLPSLELCDYQKMTCSNTLIAEKDNFLMHGSLNFTSDAQFWSPYLTIQYRHASTNYEFQRMCVFDTRVTDSNNGCNCYNCLGDFKQFTINKKAKLEYSDAEIRAVMRSLTVKGEIIYSSVHKLPTVTRDISCELEDDNGKKLDLIDDGCKTCELKSSKIRLCCNSDDGTCNPIIYNNGEKVNNSDHNCTEFVLDPLEKAHLTFEFDIAGTVFKPVIESCIVENTEQNHSESMSISAALWGTGISLLVFTIVIIVIIIGICKMRKNKGKKERQKQEADNPHLSQSYNNGCAVALVQDNVDKEQSEAGIDSTKMFLRCSEVA